MSLLAGLQIIRKRRVSVASTLLKEGLATSAVGIVHSIASVIENKDAIRNTKMLRSAFSKIEVAAYHTARPGKSNKGVDLSEEENGVIRALGEVAKNGVMSVVRIAATHLGRAMTQAFRLAIVPVFKIFCATVATVFRLVLANPYTLAAAAVIAAAIGGRKLWLNYREEKYRESTPSSVPDLPVPTPAPSSGSSGSSGFGAAPSAPDTQRTADMKVIIRDAAVRNGVSPEMAIRIATIESSLNPNSGSRSSSAKGLFGIIKGTWKGLGGVPGQELDPKANADLGTKYLKQNHTSVSKALGREAAAHEVYAAHFFGPRVSAMLKAQDELWDKPIEKGLALFNSDNMVQKILSQNPHLRGKTVGQVIEWLRFKTGDPPKRPNLTASVGTGSLIIPTSGTFTSPFGKRTFQGPRGMVSGDHKGIDIAGAIGTPIYSADAGTVVVSSTSSSGYGTRIDVDHGNGLLTRYGHSSKLYVKEGDKVRKGQHIANMGNAGFSSGPHLHFEVRLTTASGASTAVDPVPYMPGFPTAKNSAVLHSSGDQVAGSKQYIRRGDHVVAIKGV